MTHTAHQGAALNAAPFLYVPKPWDGPTIRRMHAPQPRAWLGYSSLFGDRPTVRICSKCPDRAEAEAQAERAQHDCTHTLCPRCACDTFNEILAMNTDTNLPRAVAAAQLLANSIKQEVCVYSRSIRPGHELQEWKILPASEAKPEGFHHRQSVQPAPK